MNDQTTQPTDVESTLKHMLTENTGRHFLDSGFANGRHWQKNQETPPWEKPRLQVGDGYVTRNLYHFLDELGIERDEDVRERERRFYEWSNKESRKRDAWLTCMRDWADANGEDGNDFYSANVTENTYNLSYTNLSQEIQYTIYTDKWDGEDYVLLQVHNGADVRGGYTKPRLFRMGEWMDRAEINPMEFEFVWEDEEGNEQYEYESRLPRKDEDPFTWDTENNRVIHTASGNEVSIY